MRAWLLALGVAGILAVAAAPYVRQAWIERERQADLERQDDYIKGKEAEIACLERLAASGLPKSMDVQAEIEKCRELSAGD